MDKFRLAAKCFLMHDNKMLLLRRSSTDVQKPGIWEIPGGRLEIGENPISGLKREIKEETGLDIDVLHPFNVRHFTRDDGQIITLLIFLSKSMNNNVVLSSEHSDFDWISIEDCKNKLNPFFHDEVDIFNKLELHKHI
ncbi:NUDIX domain-containing protein [Candidatus Woesearchaeota archaeon]|nr:NUDIX domain-containing protein [Candidatus Woesearchaeota archaeon]